MKKYSYIQEKVTLHKKSTLYVHFEKKSAFVNKILFKKGGEFQKSFKIV